MDTEFIPSGEIRHWHVGEPRLFPAVAEPTSKRRILIVDDDNSVRETLADLLEWVGYRPVQAANAVEALAILRQEPVIDALISDLTMVGGDGITLIRHARKLRNDLPAILLTGCAEPISNAVAGTDFYVLRKPVEGERLLAQLERLMTTGPIP